MRKASFCKECLLTYFTVERFMFSILFMVADFMLFSCILLLPHNVLFVIYNRDFTLRIGLRNSMNTYSRLKLCEG